MEWIIDNWFLLVVAISISWTAISLGIWMCKLPTETKIDAVKETLKFLVVEAEKEMGGGTGQLKLRRVWIMACETFDWLPKIVDFNTFSIWVDEALEWMKIQLDQNKAIETLVKG